MRREILRAVPRRETLLRNKYDGQRSDPRGVAVALVIATSIVEGQNNQTVPVDNAAEAAADSAGRSTDARTQVPGLQPNARYQLCKGDVVQLNFPFTPEFNQTIRVQPHGYITLLRLGDIHVEGESIPGLRRSLSDAYRKKTA